MLTINELTEKWDSMSIYNGGFVRIDKTHPLEIYIGYVELNQKTLLILIESDCSHYGTIPSSKSIIASCNLTQLYKWSLSFRLIKIENDEVFIRLCWDIIESSRDTKENTADFILKRYKRWHKLMERQRPDILDLSRQKGLLGELIYLNDALNVYSKLDAVSSWLGPEGADRDFEFPDNWVEVKTISASSENISISSLEQLDDELPGTICVIFAEKTSPENIHGFTLSDEVNLLRKLLSDDWKAKEIFENKLYQYGYSDKEEYQVQKYKLIDKRSYSVDAEFPRLTKKSIPSAIVSAHYEISLAAIDRFLLGGN